MRIVAYACLVVLGLAGATTAHAHGPCIRNVQMQSCLIPSSGLPGTHVRIVGLAYRVVWNQDVAFAGDRDRYRPGSKTITLLKLRHARQRVEFQVPKVVPGVYAVVIYDGAEDGAHYTWGLFRVKQTT
jgi:hypothetical protein